MNVQINSDDFWKEMIIFPPSLFDSLCLNHLQSNIQEILNEYLGHPSTIFNMLSQINLTVFETLNIRFTNARIILNLAYFDRLD